jgi:bacterioferritin
MKGNIDLVNTLNSLLRDELTAISQYMVHSEMCANWGFERLHKAAEKRAIDEMKHAEKLIGRVLFLEGTPAVSSLNNLQIGPDVAAQLKNDQLAETGAVRAYNDAIPQAVQAGDNGTRELLESILKDEESHIDRLEAQLDQIRQMGIQNFLAQQLVTS